MAESILGADLEVEKRKAFERRFAFVALHRRQIGAFEDRCYVARLGQRICANEMFAPCDEDATQLLRIEAELHGRASLERLQETLLEDTEWITRAGILDERTLARLNDLLDLASNRPLETTELQDLQYLVLAARSAEESGATSV